MQMYLPIFETAGSVELAVNMIIDHVHLFNAEEDHARKGNHEAALRKAISEDVTVRRKECPSSDWLGPYISVCLLGGSSIFTSL